jgi:hypothetical protein
MSFYLTYFSSMRSVPLARPIPRMRSISPNPSPPPTPRPVQELAVRLRPELEAAVAANDAAPTDPYAFDAAACAKRALKNKALNYLAALGDAAVTEDLLNRFRRGWAGDDAQRGGGVWTAWIVLV